jgi:hypothetical protein
LLTAILVEAPPVTHATTPSQTGAASHVEHLVCDLVSLLFDLARWFIGLRWFGELGIDGRFRSKGRLLWAGHKECPIFVFGQLSGELPVPPKMIRKRFVVPTFLESLGAVRLLAS